MTGRRTTTRTAAWFAAMSVAMSGLAVACDASSHGGGSASNGTAAGVGKPDAVSGGGDATSGGGDATGTSDGTDAAKGGSATTLPKGTVLSDPLARAAVDPRSVIYTGSMAIEAKDVRAAAADATRIVVAAGGVLFDASYTSGEPAPVPLPEPGQSGASDPRGTTTSSDAGQPVADLTYKLPPARFNGVVTALGEVGHTTSQVQNAQDVTDQVVDLTARVDTAQRSVGRVRALLDKATSIGDVVQLEGELSRREADLESLEGRLRVLNAQTALATLTVHISQPSAAAAAVHRVRRTGFLAGLAAGWHGFQRSLSVLLTILGAVLPFVVLGLALAALALWVRRRWHGPRPTPPAVTPDAAP